MQAKVESFGPLIVILRPADPIGGGTFDVIELDSACCFRANGDVDHTRVKEVLEVHGKVEAAGCTPVLKPGTVEIDKLAWHIDGVGPCNILTSAQPNILKVKIRYIDVENLEQISDFEQQPFRPVGTYSSCYYYTTNKGISLPAPISRLLPRYYRLACRSLQGGVGDLGLQSGGLMQSNAVYLGYDANRSTPYTAVWRSAGHFDIAGAWTLRVQSTACGATAELWLQRVMKSQVQTPLVFSASSWNFEGTSVFAPKKGSPCDDPLLAQAILEVEPA